jgi:hypothetical protein
MKECVRGSSRSIQKQLLVLRRPQTAKNAKQA